jgi:hypothetical protein
MALYKYKTIPTRFRYVLLCTTALFFGVLLAFSFASDGIGTIPLVGWGLFLLPIIFLLAAIAAFLSWRPIAINEDRIEALFAGNPTRTIQWNEAVSVEKIRYYSSASSKFRSQILIRSNKTIIGFDDFLKDFPGALAELNIYISRYNIPAYSVNRSKLEARAPIHTLLDIAEGKSLDGERARETKL